MHTLVKFGFGSLLFTVALASFTISMISLFRAKKDDYALSSKIIITDFFSFFKFVYLIGGTTKIATSRSTTIKSSTKTSNLKIVRNYVAHIYRLSISHTYISMFCHVTH